MESKAPNSNSMKMKYRVQLVVYNQKGILLRVLREWIYEIPYDAGQDPGVLLEAEI